MSNSVIQKNELEKFRYEKLLDEARKRYENIDKNFSNSRNKMFALLTAEIAIMTYLFSDLVAFFPKELYGKAIFILACLGVLISICMLFAYYRSIFNWPSPTGATDRERILHLEDEAAILKYIEEDYRKASDEANKILEKRARAFNLSMQIFAISAIILLVMKFLGA